MPAMLTREFRSLSLHGFHRVTYYEWGEPDNPAVVVCVHGLTRSGRDFDDLARALAPTHRVLAPDMPGRGRSEWLRQPTDYAFPTYLATLTALVARSGADLVDWVGTSMGGLLGMLIAAQPGSPVRRLVVNDIGPVIESAALQRIGEYVGADPTFDSYEAAGAYIRGISATFGDLDHAQWDAFVQHSVRQDTDGKWRLHYDPGIAHPFRADPAPPALWSVWDAITVPTLVLRGADSDLLSAETARLMTERGPRARLVEVPGVGHAPTLQSEDQISPVVSFLRA